MGAGECCALGGQEGRLTDGDTGPASHGDLRKEPSAYLLGDPARSPCFSLGHRCAVGRPARRSSGLSSVRWECTDFTSSVSPRPRPHPRPGTWKVLQEQVGRPE